MPSYFSLAAPSEGFFKEKGSKFLAFAYPVDDEEEVKNRLEELRKQYYDARHFCYAYIIGAQSEKYRANDDGEPNHSAGDPILGQIRSKNLTNTLVVVVRYFGGTKLGVPGLINAYKTAAREALEVAQSIEIAITDQVIIEFPYDKTSDVMRLLKEFDVAITDQSFNEACTVKGAIQPGLGESLAEKLSLVGIPKIQVITSA